MGGFDFNLHVCMCIEQVEPEIGDNGKDMEYCYAKMLDIYFERQRRLVYEYAIIWVEICMGFLVQNVDVRERAHVS